MANIQITQTFFVDRDSSNPIHVNATITAEYEYPEGWTWNVDKIHSVELVIGDKAGIDVTKQVLNDKRSLALLSSQVADLEEQIIDALAERETA